MAGSGKRRKMDIPQALVLRLRRSSSRSSGEREPPQARRTGEAAGSAGWAAAQAPRTPGQPAGSAVPFRGGRWPSPPRGPRPPVTCWSRAKNSARARPGGSAGRTARAGPAGNPAARPRRSPPAARPPGPPCCCGSDVRRDPEAVGARREGTSRGDPGSARGDGASSWPRAGLWLYFLAVNGLSQRLIPRISLSTHPFLFRALQAWRPPLKPRKIQPTVLPELVSSLRFGKKCKIQSF